MSIKSILGFIKALKKFPRDKNYEYFYRGHADQRYTLLPSVYRSSPEGKPYIENEDKIFREIIIRTPAEFMNEHTAMEKLVKMQHYGLPTRILDITSNPLVALYFACEHHFQTDGEVLVFKIPKKEIKFFDSDTVSILANLAKRPVSFDLTKEIRTMKDPNFSMHDSPFWDNETQWFNQQGQIPFLLHEIREEKPYFLPIIDADDLDRVLAVRVKLNNSRIVKQAGAFLLFGIHEQKAQPAQIPQDWLLNESFAHYDLKIDAKQKKTLLKDLDTLGFNNSTLFPELEQQAQYIKGLFS